MCKNIYKVKNNIICKIVKIKNYFSDIDDKFNVFHGLLYKTFTKYLPIIVSLLIIGSILEVIISNKLAIYFS